MRPKFGFLASPCLFSTPPWPRILLAIVVLLMGLFTFLNGYSQRLDIGDKVPAVTIGNVINNASSDIRLSDYHGQLVILDFWATWCSPCIAMFPKTDSLQKVFGGKVRFLPVTYQSEKDVRRLLSRIPALNGLNLPIVVGDTTLNRLFPHKELPHYVWIDQNGVVLAITGSEEITPVKIESILSGSGLTLEEKKDVILPYNRERPLLLNDLGFTKDDLHYGMSLTGYKEGLSMRSDRLRYPDGSFRRITVTNSTIRKLLAIAHTNKEHYFHYNRVLLEVDDPSKLVMPDPDITSRQVIREWMREHTYCYEIMVPRHLSDSISSIMRRDLTRLFPQYRASIEKRNVKCLVLVRTSDVDRIKTSGKPVDFSFDFMGASMTNCSISLLMSHLNGTRLQLLDTPVIDGTGYSGKIDIRLQGNLSDVKTLRKALHAYDLDLVTRFMDIDMLVIRDAGSNLKSH